MGGVREDEMNDSIRPSRLTAALGRKKSEDKLHVRFSQQNDVTPGNTFVAERHQTSLQESDV